MHKGKWGIALLLAVGLTACGQDVIEFRNAEIVNGKLYRSGEDVPFTGHATNVPFTKIQTDETRDFFMAKDKYASNQTNKYGGNGRPDLPDYPAPRNFICEGGFEEGAPSGDFECSEEGSENIAFTYEIGGGGISKIILFSRSKPGFEIISASYKDHKLNGEFVITSSSTEKVLYSAHYVDGRLQGKVEAMNGFTGLLEEKFEYNAETGEVLLESFHKDGITVRERATQQQNGYVTAYSAFDERGNETVRGERVNGVMTEVPVGQNAQGHVAADEPPTVEDAVSNCMRDWVDAHNREVGMHSPISDEMMKRWEDGCKADNKVM